MDFEQDEDHDALRKGARELIARYDDAYWSACDAEHRFPTEFYRTLADGGWLGVAIPEEYGGAGLGITEAVHLTLFGMNPLVKHGSVELRQELLALRLGDAVRPESGHGHK